MVDSRTFRPAELRILRNFESNTYVMFLVSEKLDFSIQRILCLGAIYVEATPVPISNTVVKLYKADGSAIARE